MRYFYSFLFLFFISNVCSAQKQQVQNMDLKQPSRFTENKGQVCDQDGKLRADVKYIYAAPGFKLILKENSFSYEVFAVEKKEKYNENSPLASIMDAGKELPSKFKEPEEVNITTHRVDINLPGANKN